MTIENTIYVIVPNELTVELSALQERADAALRRAKKLPPGDTREIARFEALSTQIERKAIAYASTRPDESGFSDMIPKVTRALLTRESLSEPNHGLPKDVCALLDKGVSIVVVGRPHQPGDTVIASGGSGPRPPAEAWRATRPGKREAETERFETVLETALALRGGKSAINPLSVSNRVLTETLRRYVQAEPGTKRIDVPVEYRDGSIADPFPLRAVRLGRTHLPNWPVLKLTLLSIRHVEMDHVVHGAWFRNARISRPGPAGLIDADAFEISMKQLAKVRATGPRIIEMHQTGFQPAVTGFYRAVTHTLIDHPGTLCVIPKFFVGKGFEEGDPWLTV